MLTQPQHRELQKIVAAGEDGRAQGTGSNWRVRDRLRQMGLVELRGVPWTGANGVVYDNPRWIATTAGVAALQRLENA